jgi:hypothetical protein
MWSAFVTGMAEKATSLIDERDKEIQEKIDRQLEKMYKDAGETKKKAQLRRDTLESTARELMTLGVSDVQAAALLQNVGPEGAANMVERLKKAEKVTPEKIRAALSQVETSEAPLDEVIARQTTPTATEVQAPQMRGAFGLPSRAGEEFAETARGIETELPAIPTTAQPLDLSVFEDVDEETFSKRKNAAQIKVLDAETPEEQATAIAELTTIAAIEDIGKDKTGDLKEADVRSNLRILDASIKQSIAGPGDLVVVTDPTTGERTFEYSKDIDPRVRQAIESKRRQEFNKYVSRFYAQEGQVPDVVQRVVGAFITQTPGVKKDSVGAGKQPAAPAATPKPVSTPAGARPIPKDTNGKVDRSKLVAGERYASSTGDVRIWNGTSFQPAK